jgi:sugar phosphate permease
LPLLPLTAVALAGVAQSTNHTIKNTLLLEHTPNELRGRIVSLNQMDRGANMLGGSVAGFTIAAVGGPSAAVIFGSFFVLGALLLAILLPNLRTAD